MLTQLLNIKKLRELRLRRVLAKLADDARHTQQRQRQLQTCGLELQRLWQALNRQAGRMEHLEISRLRCQQASMVSEYQQLLCDQDMLAAEQKRILQLISENETRLRLNLLSQEKLKILEGGA